MLPSTVRPGGPTDTLMGHHWEAVLQFWDRADPRAFSVEGVSGDGLQKTVSSVPWTEPDGSERTDTSTSLEVVDSQSKAWSNRLADAGHRAFDISFATIALLVTLPLMIAIVLAIRVSSPGAAIYRQRRVGLHGHPFHCLKFRTMVPDADTILQELLANDERLRDEFERKHKLTHDPRITWIGALLRKTSLDELPQFWNVLKGEMSVVGPRPIVHAEKDRYGPYLPLVLSVRPGLTGLWQVSGRNDTTYEERVALDRQYVLNRNLGRDLMIILKTVRAMVTPRNGAY